MSTKANRKDRGPVRSNRTGMPAHVTPFVGRRDELNKLIALLNGADVRLITILGPGGIGKTRLAQELATSLQDKFQQGAYFISLASLNTIEDFIPALAAVLDIQLPLGGEPCQLFVDALSTRQALLVLDNFEQLVREALFVHDILVNAPQVKILVTSREKLNIQEEVLFHLHGLQLPPQAGQGQFETSDAIRLFLQRGRQARPDFVSGDQDMQFVIDICRLMDGMPLGILLAAAWMEHFTPQEVAVQITHNLDFLSHKFQDLPARHRSMRAVFDSSFEMLDEVQRAAFPKLSAFRGGFRLEAAQVVAGADLEMLLSFVEKSLLNRDSNTGRYDLHELLRQYTSERLTQEESERINELHSSYYLEFVHRLKTQLKSDSQMAALNAMQADFENISQAWTWAIRHKNWHAIELATPSLYAFCDMRSRYYEGEALFNLARQGLSHASGATLFPGWAFILLSWYDFVPYEERPRFIEEITSQAQNCLKQARLDNNVEAIACGLVLLGAIAWNREELKAAIHYYRQAMQLHSVLDDFYWVNMRIGLSHQMLRQYEAAIQSFQASLTRGKLLGERVKMGWSLLNMGDTLLMAGKTIEGEKCIQDSLRLFEEIGTSIGVMWANYSLGKLAFENGNLELGKALTEKSLELAHQIGSRLWQEKIEHLMQQIETQCPKPQTISVAFSERELEVLSLLKSDLDGPEIAKKLFVSLNTVRFHTKSIYRKLQVKNRREAIRRAHELGLWEAPKI